jgi:hypothetical protein
MTRLRLVVALAALLAGAAGRQIGLNQMQALGGPRLG